MGTFLEAELEVGTFICDLPNGILAKKKKTHKKGRESGYGENSGAREKLKMTVNSGETQLRMSINVT